MTSCSLKSLVAGAALLLSTTASSAPPAGGEPKASHAETTFVKVTFKVFVTEAGVPEKFEFVGVEPSISPSVQAGLVKSVSDSIKTWTFTPSKEHGKPIAGWVLLPVMVDLADPIPVGGT